MYLNLLVIRSLDPKKLANFYTQLGLTFTYHRHGGPWHYSTESNGLVFELYPLSKGQERADTSTRLGFTVEHLDDLIRRLDNTGTVIHQRPEYTGWGYIAVVADPDGRKIELRQKAEI
jgi:predicted enzyme related to lactoylglutathione lyase